MLTNGFDKSLTRQNKLRTMPYCWLQVLYMYSTISIGTTFFGLNASTPVEIVFSVHRLTLFWQLLTCPAIPDYIRQTLPRPRQVDTVRTLRTSSTLTVPENRTSRFQRSFIPGTTRTWNKLPEHIRSQDTLNKFKKRNYSLNGSRTSS